MRHGIVPQFNAQIYFDRMKRTFLLALMAFTAVCVADLTLAYYCRAVYSHDPLMRDEPFWKGRQSFSASLEIPFVPIHIPGPLDAWGGGEQKEIKLEIPSGGATRLLIRLFDTHDQSPPIIQITMGSVEIGRFITPKGEGQGYDHAQGSGARIEYSAGIPSRRPGNEPDAYISLRTVEGSWASIDHIELYREPWRWSGPVAAGGIILLAALYVLHIIRAGACRRHALNVALVIMSVVLTLAVVELFLRRFMPQQEFVPNIRTVYDPHPVMGFMLRPNVKTEYGFDTNQYAMRDYGHYTKQKPEGVYRIICLGDSMTFSITSMEDAYPKVLERALSTGARNIEVINAGVSGYGPDEEYFYLRDYILDFDPDLVILGFFVGNDISDSYAHPSNTAVDGTLIHIEDAKKLTVSQISWEKRKREFLNRFHVARLVVNRDYSSLFARLGERNISLREYMNRMNTKCLDDPDIRIHRPSDAFSPVFKESWAKALGWINKMNSLAAVRNVKFAVAVMPVTAQFDTPEAAAVKARIGGDFQWDEPQLSFMKEAAQRGWKTFNALPAMREKWDGQPLYYCMDPHFNEVGNALFAHTLGEWLQGERLIPAPREK